MQRIREGLTGEKKDQDHFLSISEEILLLIFSFEQDPCQLGRLGITCKLFLRVASDNQLWTRFLDEYAKAEWRRLGKKEQQPASVKQFIVNKHPWSYLSFSLFSNVMSQMYMRRESSMHIDYALDQCFVASEFQKNTKQINGQSRKKLEENYNVVIQALNRFYDLCIAKIQQIDDANNIFRSSSAFKHAFEMMQRIVIADKTESILFQYPGVIDLICQFGEKLTPKNEFKLTILIDTLTHPKVTNNPDIEKIIECAIECMDNAQVEKDLFNGCIEGEWGHDSVVSSALMEVAMKQDFQVRTMR